MYYFNNAIDGPCDFYDLYDLIIRKMPYNFKFAEVGVGKGKSLAFFVAHSLNLQQRGQIFAVDSWEGFKENMDQTSSFFEPILQNNPNGLYELFLKNISPGKTLVTIIKKNIINAAKTFDNNSLNGIFIKTSHDYEEVLKDLIAWYPKKIEDGVFCGHDYISPGIRKAVDEFATLKNLKISPIGATSWIIQ
jgi:hypothetical protein